MDDEQKNQYDWGPWIACMGLVVLFWIIFALVLWPRDRDSEAKLAEFKIEYESRSNFQNAMMLQRRANRPGAANRKGDLQGAINLYTRVTYEPDMVEKALLYSGLAKFQLKDYPGAIDDYTAAVNLDLHPAWAISARGVAKYVSGDKEGAMEDIQQSRDLDETLPWPHHNEALIHIQNGNNDEALEKLIYILKEFPTFPESYDTLGVLKYRQGQLDEAMALFNDSASLNVEGIPRAYTHVYLNRAALKREIGDSRGAESDMAEYNNLIR